MKIRDTKIKQDKKKTKKHFLVFLIPAFIDFNGQHSRPYAQSHVIIFVTMDQNDFFQATKKKERKGNSRRINNFFPFPLIKIIIIIVKCTKYLLAKRVKVQ